MMDYGRPPEKYTALLYYSDFAKGIYGQYYKKVIA